MPPPRLNVADKYGSPRYTSISQTQPDGATAAATKMTRWIDDSSRRRWGRPPREVTGWDYGAGGRPWGAPANNWDFEQEHKEIIDRQGSDQAISDWIARTQDAQSVQSKTGLGEAPDFHDGWNDTACGASTSLNQDGWNRTSEASSRFGYHPLSHQSDYEDQSNGWGGNPKRSRAKAQKDRSDWQTRSRTWEEQGCEQVPGCVKSSTWSMESGRDNNGWGETPAPRHGWKDSGWDASTGMQGQGYDAHSLSNAGDIPVSEHFDHEDQSDGWGYRPKDSRAEPHKGRSGWGDESEHGENSGWGKESGWEEEPGWIRNIGGSASNACINSHRSQGHDSSTGYLLTPSQTTEPSAESSWAKQHLTTQRQDEEVKDLRRQLAEEKRKNAELGRRLYTLENEGLDPGSVFLSGGGEEDTVETAAFEWPPYTPFVPDIQPKISRKVATSSAETEHFDTPPKRLPQTTLDSIASSLPASQAHHAIQQESFNEEGRHTTTNVDRYTGIIRDKVYSTRPLTFSMSRNATFGDILRSWKKRRGIKDDDLALFREWDGVVSLENTPSMEGIIGEYIELNVIRSEKFDVDDSVKSGEWEAAGW